MKIYIYITLLLFGIQASCFGAIITALDNEDGTWTITGTSFGSKTTPSPVKWATFDTGVDGENLTTLDNSSGCTDCWTGFSVFSAYGSEDAKYESSVSRDGTKCIKTIAGINRPTGPEYGDSLFTYQAGQDMPTFYMSVHVKMSWGVFTTPEDDGVYQWKIIRIKDHDNADEFASPNIYLDSWVGLGGDGLDDFATIVRYSKADINLQPLDLKSINHTHGFLESKWVTLQIWAKADATSGEVGWIISSDDGETNIRRTYTGVTRTEGEWRDFMFGHIWANVNTGTHTATNYWDDVYIDNTYSRVIIGNSVAYEDSTKFENQIVSSWKADGTEIELFENQGASEDNTTYYIWVIDNDGVVSDQDAGIAGAQGFPITLSSTNPSNVISTTDNQTVSSSAFTINGTATATTGRTISSVTIPGETVTLTSGAYGDQTVSWSCTVSLSSGLNTYAATATDDSAETGTDSINVTYTPITASGAVSVLNTGTVTQSLNSGRPWQVGN